MSRVQVFLNEVGDKGDANPSSPKEEHLMPRFNLELALFEHELVDLLIRLLFLDPVGFVFTLQIGFHPILKSVGIVIRKVVPKINK